MLANIFEIHPRWDSGSSILYPFQMHGKKDVKKGLWVFDDKERDIKDEPFVGNTNTIIDFVTMDIKHRRRGFRLQFSDTRFEGCHDYPLIRGKLQYGGCWYTLHLSKDISATGWLCKVIYKYFETPPENIWFKVSKL